MDDFTNDALIERWFDAFGCNERRWFEYVLEVA